MISHFSILGDLYNHEDFDTEATEWGSYPWISGLDNKLDISLEAEVVSDKTRWDDIAGDRWREDSIRVLNIDSMTVSFSASLVRFDQWGNVGSESGVSPEVIPDGWLFQTGAQIASVTSELVFTELVFDSNSDQPTDADVYTSSAQIVAVSSVQQYFPNYFDSHSDSDAEGAPAVQSVTITNVTSILQV